MLIIIGILLVSVSVCASSASVNSADLLQLDDVQNVPDSILSLLQPKKHRNEFQVGALTHKLLNAEPKHRYQKKNKKKLSNKVVLDAIENIVQQLKSKFGDTFKAKNRNTKDRPAPSKDRLNRFSYDPVKTAAGSERFENTINNVLQNMMKPAKKSRPGKLVQPSNLLQGNNVNLDKYSKIFIILNPQALGVKPAGSSSGSRQATMPRIRKKRYFYHTRGTSAPQHQEQHQDREVVIYADWRRRMDDDSVEGPKAKRPRAGDNYRTAIPFIGRKGDVYERDD